MQPDLRGPFLPGELVNPRLHATMDGLEVRGLCLAHRAELDQIAEAEEISATAAGILVLAASVPRPRGRPMGVGLQLSAESMAAVLGRSERMIHYAVRQLEAAKLVTRFAQIRSVKHLTRNRAQPLRAFSYVGKGGAIRSTTKAHSTAVLYPTLRGLDAAARHGWTRGNVPGKGRHTIRAGVAAWLLETLSSWIRAVARRCGSDPDDCTPYTSQTCRSGSLPGTATATPGVVAPSALSLDAHDRTALSDPRSARGRPEGTSKAQGAGGDPASAEVERCWSHFERVELYANTRAPKGWNVERWSLGFGYEANRATGRLEARWAPILTAARWRPEAWRRGSADERAALVARFEPIRRELTRRIAAGVPPPEPPPAGPEEK